MLGDKLFSAAALRRRSTSLAPRFAEVSCVNASTAVHYNDAVRRVPDTLLARRQWRLPFILWPRV